MGIFFVTKKNTVFEGIQSFELFRRHQNDLGFTIRIDVFFDFVNLDNEAFGVVIPTFN